jgi:hypothetical protein
MLILIYPSGESQSEPTNEDLRLLLEYPERFFLPSGCGEAALERRDGKRSGLLGIRHAPGIGFSLEHCRAEEHGRPLESPHFSCAQIQDGEVCTVAVGGMPLRLPRASIYDPGMAFAIVRHFSRTGERCPAVPWVSTNNLPTHLYGQ